MKENNTGYTINIGIALKKSDFEKMISKFRTNSQSEVIEIVKRAKRIVERNEKIAVELEWDSVEQYSVGQELLEFVRHTADGYALLEMGETIDHVNTEYVDSSDGITFYEDIEIHREICIQDGVSVTIE